MDYLANINHVGLNLSKNPIVVNVDPASPVTYPERVDLRYFLEVYVPEFSGAGTFQKLTTLEASEIPPTTAAGATSYPGAYFQLEEILHSLLESCVPDWGLNKITLCNTLTSPYYTKAIRKDGTELIDETLLPSAYAYRGGVNTKHYADWKESFFTGYVGANRKFLTWKLNNAPIREDQPEYLHFLTNFSPLPTALKLRVQVYYSDGTTATITALTSTDVQGMGVYVMPVGPTALGLLSLPKVVDRYNVWLSNQSDERVSEERSYIIDRSPIRQVRYILFQNSLGVYDTLACTGDATESLKVSRQLGERFTGYDYLPGVAETVINRVTGERELSLAFGFPRWNGKAWREYWQEVIFSESAYLVTDRAHIPLRPLTDTYLAADDNEEMIGRGMTYRYTNEERGYSVLPPVVSVSRATGWRGEALSCELDASTGLRNGSKRYELLVQYYLDNGVDVKPLTQKANVPGTVGYIPSWSSEDCEAATTPFLNTLLSRSSVLLRNDCDTEEVGTGWTISIPAGTYGSEISQADADAKATAAAAALDTQANANTYGSCIITTPVELGLINNLVTDVSRPFFAVFIGGVELIGDTVYQPTAIFADDPLDAGTYNIDVRARYNATEGVLQSFRITIPSKGFDSGSRNGNQTYRIGNVPVSWGDPDLIIVCQPV